jgi:hypothetical protein
MNPGLSPQLDEFHPQFDVEKSITPAKELTKLAERVGLILQVSRWLFFTRSSIICLKYGYVSLFLVDRRNRL